MTTPASTFSSLPNTTFTNNVGSVTFKQATFEVADEWRWDGRVPIRTKRISLEGNMTRDPSEVLNGILTGPGSAGDQTQLAGRRGTLALPWTTLSNVRIEGFDCPPGTYPPGFFPVSATFVDDLPDNNTYIIHLFGVELQNPKIRIPMPARLTTDDYVQVPANLVSANPAIPYGAVTAQNPWYGPIRYISKFGMMGVEVSGTYILDTDKIVTSALITTLTQRVGYGSVTAGPAGLPPGYPAIFNLAQAIPEISADFNLTGCFVAGGQINWDVEHLRARIQLLIMAQPQQWQ